MQSTLLSSLDGLIHGYSTRRAGDMQGKTQNSTRFAQQLGFKQPPVFAGQVHKSTVAMITRPYDSTADTDGLVSSTVPVAVVTADCVPVLLVDPVAHLCAAVHAGWKGTLESITSQAVRVMVQEGAQAGRIRASIGPHIGACCYDVPHDRIRLFEDRFGREEKMTYQSEGRAHLDVGWINYRQLCTAGLTEDHIDAPASCTSCQNGEFFSYRKDQGTLSGKMMAVIGFQTI